MSHIHIKTSHSQLSSARQVSTAAPFAPYSQKAAMQKLSDALPAPVRNGLNEPGINPRGKLGSSIRRGLTSNARYAAAVSTPR